MTEEPKQKSDNELLMIRLCEDKHHFRAELEKARISSINTTQAIFNYNALLLKTEVSIKELERKGIKRVEVKPDEGSGKEAPKGGLQQTAGSGGLHEARPEERPAPAR